MRVTRVEDFRAWLDNQILTQASGTRLAGIRELSREWNLSVSTISRVLGEFRKKDRITTVRGKGIFIGGSMKLPDRIPKAPLSSARRLADMLRTAIVRNVYRKGSPLPSSKFLQIQFKVSPSTVRKAYAILHNAGTVVKRGKKFFAAGMTAGIFPGSGDCLMFVNGPRNFRSVFHGNRFAQVYAAMETELRLAGRRLVAVPLQDFHTQQKSIILSPPSAMLFINLSKVEALDLAPRLKEIFHRKKSVHLPVIIESPASPVMSLPADVLVFSHARLYRFLIRSLYNIFERGGIESATVFSVFPHENFMTELLESLLSTEVPGFEVSSVRLERNHGRGYGSAEKADRAETAEDMAHVWNREIHRIYTQSGSRTWICPSDHSAAILTTWMRRKGIHLPKDAQIISFFNIPQYIELGISTIDPDFSQLGFLMAHHIIGDLKVERSTRGFLKHAGRFVSRDTF